MNFKICFLFSLFLGLLPSYKLLAQIEKTRCNTGELIQNSLNNPTYIETQRFIKEASKRLNFDKSDTVITIPVVVHIIYKNYRQKIYDDQVYSQIDALNKDFRKLNSDTNLVKSGYSLADTKIEFCLTSTKPDGSSTPGITLNPTTKDGVGVTEEYHVIAPSWGNEYLNIWVCDYGNNIAGRGTPPGSVPINEDGIIIDFTNFGTNGRVIAPYNLGRTVTHEVGHWLNLFHIWGQNDRNPNCSSDDLVFDTPSQSAIYFNCPSSGSSCGDPDMLTNFMGYVDDACMANFTNGQKTRMRATLLTARSSVVNSTKGCRSVGIEEKINSESFSIFPNPSSTTTFLSTSLPNGFEGFHIEIINQIGQVLISKEKVISKSITLQTSNFPAGVYFIKVENGVFFTIKKLIINN